MVSPTGARLGKVDHPHLPLSLPEIVAEARACHAAGAGALHLHIRDEAGRHSLDPGRYAEALAALGEAVPDMAVQITTESAGIYDIAAQAACLRALAPCWASAALREMSVDMEAGARLYAEAAERGTEIQHILYAPGDIDRLFALQNAGLLPPGRMQAIFVLGSYGTREAAPGDLDAFLARSDADRLDWMACAFGRQERACLTRALALGGKARVGFENNIRQPDGRLLDSNAQSLTLLIEAAQADRAMEG